MSAPSRVRFARLTRRERQILALVIQGLTSRQVGAALGISHRTVALHRSRILLKTDTRNVVELVRLAVEEGMAP